MEIQIHINVRSEAEHRAAILEEGMDRISRIAKEKPQWEQHQTYGYYKTECDVPEDDLLPVLKDLIAKYPELDLYAVCSQSIREDDRSADWWRITKIETEHHPDGTASLRMDSNTYWA